VEHHLALNPRWRDAGIFEGILEALVASGAGDGTIQMIDSTVIRAHHRSAGAKKGGVNLTTQAGLVVVSAPKFMC
jgi:transposase